MLEQGKYTQSPLGRAQALVPHVLEAADRIDAERQLPENLVARFVAAGMFHLLVPTAYGGEEMAWPAYLDVVRTIAHADVSTAWCLNQGAVFATTSARCPKALGQEVWGNPATVVGNGPPRGARSESVDGGYLLTGSWMFSSGCRHANWIAAVSRCDKRYLLHLLPKERVQFVDHWQVNGLRGTGSFGFEVESLFVSETHTIPADPEPVLPGPLYVVPRDLLFASGFASVALGVARSALDAVLEFAQTKKPAFSRESMALDPVVQQKVGMAEATWAAARRSEVARV